MIDVIILLAVASFVIWAAISGRKLADQDHAAWLRKHREYLRRLDLNKTTDE